MMSDRYQRLFPTRLAPRRQAVPEFETTQQGSRIATSVGGVLIGRSFGSGSTPSRSGPVANCSSGCRLSIPVCIRTGSCGHSSVASKGWRREAARRLVFPTPTMEPGFGTGAEVPYAAAE